MMLRNLYGIDLGTSGLILQAQSREEIFADRIIAIAFRDNRIKNRDLWDIAWLTQQGVELPAHLVPLNKSKTTSGRPWPLCPARFVKPEPAWSEKRQL
jgi:hypothetical protein